MAGVLAEPGQLLLAAKILGFGGISDPSSTLWRTFSGST
jgi:hypothetical protein